MPHVHLADVFTVDEISRAVGAPESHLEALIALGELRLIPATRFVSAAEAIRIGRSLRRRSPQMSLAPPDLFAPPSSPLAHRRAGGPAALSSFAHVLALAAISLLTTMTVGTAVTEPPANERARLVFIVSPGPGGGGGGGGLHNPLPAPEVQRGAKTPRRDVLTVPDVTPKPVMTTTRRDIEPPKRPTPAEAPVTARKPVEKAPALLPSNVLVAPVVARASDAKDRDGIIETGAGDASSRGSGTGGGAGTGQGSGNGEGAGAGIGDGSGGGTGGGPYRPGSGIEAPRLLREVKADYTDEARRRSMSGDVVLEIVVRSNGTVGDVRVLQALGGGLEQQAIQAVRQWTFEPARRKGVPVDVLVEVAVEFMLR